MAISSMSTCCLCAKNVSTNTGRGFYYSDTIEKVYHISCLIKGFKSISSRMLNGSVQKLKDLPNTNDLWSRFIVSMIEENNVFDINQVLSMDIPQEVKCQVSIAIAQLPYQALAIHVLSIFNYQFSPDERMMFIPIASRNGNYNVIEYLLKQGEISEGTRVQALLNAIHNHLEPDVIFQIIRQLEIDRFINCSHYQFSQDDREALIPIASRNGNYNLVEHLLKQGEISEQTRGQALFETIHSCLSPDGIFQVIQRLEIDRFINCSHYQFSPDEREALVLIASRNGNYNLVEHLLMQGEISEQTRGQALIEAIHSHFDPDVIFQVIQRLEIDRFINCSHYQFSPEERASLILIASRNGKYNLIEHLLKQGEISEGTRVQALIEAIHSCRHPDDIFQVIQRLQIEHRVSRQELITAEKEAEKEKLLQVASYLKSVPSSSPLFPSQGQRFEAEELSLVVTNNGTSFFTKRERPPLLEVPEGARNPLGLDVSMKGYFSETNPFRSPDVTQEEARNPLGSDVSMKGYFSETNPFRSPDVTQEEARNPFDADATMQSASSGSNLFAPIVEGLFTSLEAMQEDLRNPLDADDSMQGYFSAANPLPSVPGEPMDW